MRLRVAEKVSIAAIRLAVLVEAGYVFRYTHRAGTLIGAYRRIDRAIATDEKRGRLRRLTRQVTK